MNKNVFLFVFTILFAGVASAQEVRITGHQVVAADSTWTVPAGTTILFGPNASVEVLGGLDFRDKQTAPSASPPAIWLTARASVSSSTARAPQTSTLAVSSSPTFKPRSVSIPSGTAHRPHSLTSASTKTTRNTSAMLPSLV